MRAHFAFFAFTGVCALASACSDDKGQSSDTIDDTPDVVDSSDGTDATDAATDTTPGDADATDTAPDTTPGDSTTPVDTSPGDTTPVLAVVINEVAAAGDPADWVELYNAGSAAVDLTGWTLGDSDVTHQWPFKAGTTIAKGAYLVIERDDAGLTGFNFGLGGADAVYLRDVDTNNVDVTSWNDGESPVGNSWGRFPNASGPFKTLVHPTKNAANVDNDPSTCGNGVIESLETCDTADVGAAKCSDFGWGGGTLGCIDNCTRLSQTACTNHAPALVINEVESDDSDRIELFNGTAASVDLSGYVLKDSGGGEFKIKLGTTLAAGAYLVFEKGVDQDFGLGTDDAVSLTDPDDKIIDEIAWRGGATPSYARHPNGVGGFSLTNMESFGEENF